MSSDKNKIIGIDEAGRGCLCGPVVVAGVYLPEDFDVKGVRDSKKITSEKRREEIFERIINFSGVIYHIEVIDHEVIDKINILGATLYGMKKCGEKVYEKLKVESGDKIVIKIDGNKKPELESIEKKGVRVECLVGGDSKELSISAASIIAKVSRDKIMIEYSKKYPEWELDKNKGYPNKFHMDKVKSGEWTEIHRKSFNPLKSLLKN